MVSIFLSLPSSPRTRIGGHKFVSACQFIWVLQLVRVMLVQRLDIGMLVRYLRLSRAKSPFEVLLTRVLQSRLEGRCVDLGHKLGSGRTLVNLRAALRQDDSDKPLFLQLGSAICPCAIRSRQISPTCHRAIATVRGHRCFEDVFVRARVLDGIVR